MSQSFSNQTKIDTYFGKWTEIPRPVPQVVPVKPDTHITDYFRPRSMEVAVPMTTFNAALEASKEEEESLLHDVDDIDDLLGHDPTLASPQRTETQKRGREQVEAAHDEGHKKRRLIRRDDKESKNDRVLSANPVEMAAEETDKPVEAAARLAQDLFGSDDFEPEEQAPKNVHGGLPAGDNEPMEELMSIVPADTEWQQQQQEPDISGRKKLKIVMEESIPLEFGRYDLNQVRCVYMANPLTEGWTPLEIDPLLQDDEYFDILQNVTYDERAITSTTWGVFTTHEADTETQKRRKNRNLLDAPNSDQVESLNECHWFVLIGPDRVMKLIASPFFLSTVRVIRVERRHVKFGWKKQVPIFYAYSLVRKVPLWPKEENWKPGQLMRLMCDTLYAHVELSCTRSGDQVRDCAYKVLSEIEAFPMALSKPSETCLAPAQVPMNNYSPRKDRMDHLKKFIVAPFKINKHQPVAYATTPIQDTKPLLGCLSTLVTPADYLLLDLEKPSDIWDTIVDKFGVPVHVVSDATSWQNDRQDAVTAKLKVFTQLSNVNQLSKDSPLLTRDLMQVAQTIRFAPEWFDGWFNFARHQHNRPERLELFAFFAAVALWNQVQQEAARFGSISTFLLTKAKQEYLFDQGYLWADEERLMSIRLAGDDANKTRPGDEHAALTDEERTQILVQVIDHFKTLNKAKQPSPFVIHCDAYSSITSTAAIHADRYKTSLQLAQVVLQVCVLFANVRDKITPSALASMPPLLVQSCSIYGKTTDNQPETIHKQLALLCGKDAQVLIIPSHRNLAELAKIVQKYARPHVIVLDDFHNWSMTQLTFVLTNLKQGQHLDKCTHLVVLGYTNTLGYINGGASLIWELMEVAERLEDIMGFKSSDGPVTVAPLLQSLKATRFQPLTPSLGAARGSVFYPMLERREQIRANEKVLLFSESKNLALVCRYILSCIERMGKVRTLFLGARFTTLKPIKTLLSAQNYALFNVKPSIFEFFTFHAVETEPLLMRDFDYIVFADLDYTGPGRVNFMHFNAAFEQARKGILFISELSTVDTYDVSQHFDDLFMSNDIKSERHLLNLARCPVLRDRFFDKYFHAPDVMNILKGNRNNTRTTKKQSRVPSDD